MINYHLSQKLRLLVEGEFNHLTFILTIYIYIYISFSTYNYLIKCIGLDCELKRSNGHIMNTEIKALPLKCKYSNIQILGKLLVIFAFPFKCKLVRKLV